jgi:hypothetical protein
MSSAKPVFAAGLVALALAGCASNTKPLAGTTNPDGQPIGRGRVDSPITHQPNHLECMEQKHLPVVQVSSTELQIGDAPAGPQIVFEPTPGVAQGMQIRDESQGAEVIGSALLYPNQGSADELSQVEDCLAQDVFG